MKFFTVPSDRMKEFAHEARKRGLLFVPIRNKQHPGQMEIVVFADDAAKVNRVLDCLNLDFVKAQAGDAAAQESPAPDRQAPQTETPPQTETVHTQDGEVEFEVGGFEDAFNMEDAGNFTPDRASDSDSPAKEKNLSGRSSNSNGPFPDSVGNEPGKHSVKQQLNDIRQQQANKKIQTPGISYEAPSHPRPKKKIKGKGR